MSVQARRARPLEVRRTAVIVPEDEVAGEPERGLTLEVGLYVVAVALGALLRLLLLDSRPLSVEEGTLAAESYRIMQAQPAEQLRQGPLTAYGTAVLLAMFAGTDAAARLLSAICGTALVSVLYLLRRDLGRVPALVAAFGIAISPLMVFASRDVSGGVVPLTLGALLWYALRSGLGSVGQWRAYAIALLLAGLLTSGPEGLTVMLTLGVAAVLSHPQPLALLQEVRVALWVPMWRRPALLLVGAALAIGTGFGTNPGGVQSVLVDVWTGWLRSFSLSAPRGWMMAVLGLYELPVVVLGLAQLFRTILQRGRTDMFLSLWGMLLLLMGMLQVSRPLAMVVLALFPLYLLGARLLADSLPLSRAFEGGWRWNVTSILVLVPISVGIVMLNRASMLPNEPLTPWLYGEMAMVVAAALAVGLLLRGRSRLALGWYALAILGGGFMLHGMVYLNFNSETVSRELVVGTQVSPQVRAAGMDAAYYSAHLGAQVTVDPQLQPASEWYLRQVRAVQYATDISRGIGFALLQPGQEMAAGSERRPGFYAPAIDPRDVTWQGVWRWMVSRDGLVRPNQRDIIVRAPAGNW